MMDFVWLKVEKSESIGAPGGMRGAPGDRLYGSGKQEL